MTRTARHLALLILLLTGVAGAVAQSYSRSVVTQGTYGAAEDRAVKHGLHKSLMGIEVHFRFDKSQLDLSYMGNAEALDRFARVLDSIGITHIDSVVIVSQSSPEGVYQHNVKLSQRRAATMRRAIEERHPELAHRLHVHPDGESWEQLRQYVMSDTRIKESTRRQVLRVIDADVNIATKKWRMERLPIYRYLRQTYYPRIRNSVFCIIYFDLPLPIATVDEPRYEIELDPILDPIPVTYEYARKQPMLGLHTNLLYDLGTALNIGFEYYPRNSRYTLATNWTYPWWSHDKSHHYFQLLDGEIQLRRYFKKGNTWRHRPHHVGHYLALYGHSNLYDISLNAQDAWQGEGWGAGLAYGYVWRPIKHDTRWKVEAFIRFGYYQSLYDPYHASDPYNGKYYYDWEGMPEDFISRNYRLRWFGPTGAGITIRYDLIDRTIRKEVKSGTIKY